MLNRRLFKNILGIGLALLLAAFASFLAVRIVQAASNISTVSNERWAWNDIVGWIQFNDAGGTMTPYVRSSKFEGYASSSVGYISLDCATSPNGNICGQSNYYVRNDGMGSLSGWGWNDNYGWISFCGGLQTTECPGTISYRVLIDPNNGDFSNYAWNDALGWMSFNCTNHSGGGCTTYKVKTTWIATSTSGYLDSSIYDTGVAGGAQINSVIWRGSQPSGTRVGFKFAGSNSTSGPWSYLGPNGTTSNDDIYEAASSQSKRVDYQLHNNQRYFRYRAILISNQAQTLSPSVDEVLVNWSP